MNTLLLSVSHCGYAVNSRPRLLFRGGWLAEMGFVPGALIQALPEPGGMVFNLCDQNIGRFSDLYHATKQRGGSLVQVCVTRAKGYKGPNFVTTGKYIYKGGLAPGDPLVAKYDYGLIRVRKIDPAKLGFENVKVIIMTSYRDDHTGKPVPKVRLSGEWLTGAGFTPGVLVTALAAPGSLTFKLRDEGIERYSGLVKYARANKMKLIQAYDEYGLPVMCVSGSILHNTGFTIGDTLAASYGYGEVKLQKLDFHKLGF